MWKTHRQLEKYCQKLGEGTLARTERKNVCSMFAKRNKDRMKESRRQEYKKGRETREGR